MADVISTPKSAAALASPKIIKSVGKSFMGYNNIPSVAYGCEHIQDLFKEKRKLSVQQYSLILQTVFDKPTAISRTLRSGEPHLCSTFLCLQCPSVHSVEQKDTHWRQKGHAFSVDSTSGCVYCQECEDFIYDPSLEEYRQQRGKRKRKLDEFYASPDDARLVTANSQPIPCRANGLRGLYNMGQTCFMSVILQCLIHNPFVRAYYLGEGHKSADCEKESCTSCAMDEMFTEFYSVEKTEGFGAVGMLMGSWMGSQALAGYQQQDAHEYMQFLLHSLHEENAEDGDEQRTAGSTANSSGRDGKNEADCGCIIHKTFYGKLQSTVTCDKCKNMTTRVEPVMDLSLDIRSQVKKRKLEKAPPADSSDPAAPRDIEITDCLERFTGRERLGSGEGYACGKCSSGQSGATKQLSVKRLPPCLPIHLKRFEHSKQNASKLATRIRFPLKLSMYPFTTRARAAAAPTTGRSRAEKPPPPTDQELHSTLYELSSVVVHKGGIDSGHYVSYSRDGNEWFMFDDNKVVLASEAEVLAAEAYLLFYVVSTLD